MSAPTPHAGPCKRCGNTEDVTGLGRFRGLCPTCRPIVASEQLAKRNAAHAFRRDNVDGMENEIRSNATNKPRLAAACKELVVCAERLEAAIDQKKLAHQGAQAAVAAFKAQLRHIGEVGQSLLNVTGTVSAERASKAGGE